MHFCMLKIYLDYEINFQFSTSSCCWEDFFLKINKRVVPIKESVVGKIVPERIGVWTWQLGTLEYAKSCYKIDFVLPFD